VMGQCRGVGTRCAYGRSPSLASAEYATYGPGSWNFIRRVCRAMPSKKGGPGLLPAGELQDALKAFTTVPDPAPRFVKWGPGGAEQSHQ